MKHEHRKRKLGNAALTAAIFFMVFVLAIQFTPKLTYAMSNLPVIGPIVRVITFGKYENIENGYSAKVTTPQIQGLLNKDLEEKINQDFKENATAVIAAYEQDVKQLKEEFGDETVHMGVESNYIVKTDSETFLALDVYLLNIAGSSSTQHTYYTIQKQTGELVTLKEIFKEGSDYTNSISQWIKQEMVRRNQEEDGLFWIEGEADFESFRQIAEDQKFYINNQNQLVICFDKYEVAAGAQGSPEFIIPKELIQDQLSDSFKNIL